MDVVQQLKKALECPCCMEEPQPNTTSVGLCSHGHMTCEPCATLVLQQTNTCPVCRQPTFRIVRGHKLAVSVIQIMAAFLIYRCRHANCPEQRSGDEITQHEMVCLHKPVKCPRQTCPYSAPLYAFMDGSHNTCVSVCGNLTEDKKAWCFTINAAHVYCFDTNVAKVSPNFSPVILQGTTENGYVSNAYINIKERNGGVVIFAGWLNNKSHVEEKYKSVKIEVFVYINTRYGSIGLFSSKAPIFEGEPVPQDEDGVFIPRAMLYNWADWAGQYCCHECPTQKRKPHIHVEVNFKV